MKTYDKYKPSGIDWIGDIPEHWEVKKLKFVGESIIGITYSPDDVSPDETGLLVLRSSNIQNGFLEFDDCVYVSKKVHPKHLTKAGDILICARNGSAHLVGKSAFIDEKSAGLTFGAFMSVFRSQSGRFLYYFFNSEIFKAQTGLFSTSTINQLTSDTLNNLFIGFPIDNDEQTAIANYLDEKTAQIDSLINNKVRLIELLKEERRAIINQAVTRGINAQATLKPSGIDWLRSIPEHWEVKKLKYVANFKSGEGITSDAISDEGEYPVYGGNGLRGYFSSFTHEGNFVLIGRQGALCGNINYAFGKFWASEHAVVATLLDEYEVFWFGELLRIMNLNQYSQSAAQPGLAVENIKNLSIPVPPFKEQKQIVEFIETATSKIDAAIAKIEKEIGFMREYRTALISEVVTGKIKVV